MSLSLQNRAGTANWLLAGGAVGVFILGVVVGVVIDGSDEGTWIEGEGFVGDQVVTIEADDWTYGVRGSVPTWIDVHGTYHDGGWPTCLEKVGSSTTVRFVAQEVDVDGLGFRPIVAVDCRG